MTITMPIGEARSKLTRLPRELHNRDTVTVTSKGKPVLAVVPWELFESIVETLEIMGDKDLMPVLRDSIAQVKKGNAIPWEKVRKELLP